MKAVTYQGIRNVETVNVNDPAILQKDDMIIRMKASSICGSDLHYYHGMIPSYEKGGIIGHEAIGIVEEAGSEVHRYRKGDRVVIPFNIACGECEYCLDKLESQCEKTNNYELGGAFGCSRLNGGYSGCQAEYIRVPYANFTSFRVPEHCEVSDDNLLLLSDCLPTAYWSVINSGVKSGDTVIILGCGPVGQLCAKLCWLQGAERVIVVDPVESRLAFAKRWSSAETFDLSKDADLGDHLKEITKGGAHVVIDCVGMNGKMSFLETVESALRFQGGSMGAIRMATQIVRKGGTVQLTGIYGLRYNAFPLGDFAARNVNLRMGIAPVIHLIPHLFEMVAKGEVDPSVIISHRFSLSDAPEAYRLFAEREDGCLKILLHP